MTESRWDILTQLLDKTQGAAFIGPFCPGSREGRPPPGSFFRANQCFHGQRAAFPKLERQKLRILYCIFVTSNAFNFSQAIQNSDIELKVNILKYRPVFVGDFKW